MQRHATGFFLDDSARTQPGPLSHDFYRIHNRRLQRQRIFYPVVKTYIHQIFEDVVGPLGSDLENRQVRVRLQSHGFDPARGKETDWLDP
jgi:hypothetical protein